MDISIVLPIYNEVDNLQPLCGEITTVMRELGRDYEVILVDDGSSDGSRELLVSMAKQDEHLKVVLFRRNFGQTPAMMAGFDYSSGEIIITLDADRQNDPADIPTLIAKVEEGYDLVSGWRYHRKDGFLLRRLPSMIANRIISYTTDVSLHDYGCSLKAFRCEVAKSLHLYGEMHRFIPAIASWMGVRIAEIKVNHRPRVAGTSKYGISRTFRVILDLIAVKYLLSYSSRPVQFFGSLGLLSGALGTLIAFWLAFERMFMGVPLGNRPLFLFAILLIFIGLQFITVGLLAEMQTRIYHETQNKPVYVVREVIN